MHFVGYVYIVDLNKANNIEHFKIYDSRKHLNAFCWLCVHCGPE